MFDLDEQLRLLVQQYGIAAVRQRLKAITRPPVRKNARDYVMGMNVPGHQKETLLGLAQLFEERRFLPKAADIRNFFEAYGGPVPPKLKARKDAVPVVFRFLSSLSDERLDRIANEGSFAGPSELGPIADAIKARGAVMTGAETAAKEPSRDDHDLDPLRPPPDKANAYR